MTDIIAASVTAPAWTPEALATPLPGVTMYRYRDTVLRIAVMLGKLPGTTQICGIFVMFRASDDSMNMECSVPLDIDQMKATLSMAVALCSDKQLSHDKFLACLEKWYANKTGRPVASSSPQPPPPPPHAQDTTSTTSLPSVPISASSSQTAKRARDDDDDAALCCICHVNDADTVAVPCMHRVVCAECSVQLNEQKRFSTQCVVCRQTITNVGYPDNTMPSTKESHTK